ncbi:DUF1192 domain-containing protein [Hyphomonas chukchiensis]|uniref:DUF1192 domain-containing protein n=1 Tax=Hyphomonas chukchiensis TaxID=1280947 RepID=UPI001F525FA8|nr:DUF1192 domain-containing protein [Hyphomonas chukchiensis]
MKMAVGESLLARLSVFMKAYRLRQRRRGPLFEEEPILTNRGQTLDQMSIDELHARISTLRDQIAACEAEIAKKEAQKSAADALFGGKS